MTTSPSPRLKRTNDPAATRARVLDVAAAAFQSRGFHATSTHEVRRAAQVTAGAMHHHFPTKKALGLSVIRERVAATVQATWITPVLAAPSAAAGIAQVFESIAAGLEERGRVQGCPLTNLALELSLTDPDFRGAVHDVFEAWQQALAEKLAADQAAGITGPRDAPALATFVIASYAGAMAIAKARQDAAPLRECARQLATLCA